jgi:hypothetical protein
MQDHPLLAADPKLAWCAAAERGGGWAGAEHDVVEQVAVPMQCAPRLAEGTMCMQTIDCQDGLYCSKDSACHKRVALGEVCKPDTQDVCVQGGKCQPRDLSLALQPRTASSPPIESVCVPENLPLFCWAH